MKTFTWTRDGQDYTLTERLVQVGTLRFAKKPVYDLTTRFGTYHYDEANLIAALANRFGCQRSTAVKVVNRFKGGELRNACAM